MTSDDEWTTTPDTSGGPAALSSPRRLFNLKLVNSYGNANMEPLLSEPTAVIRLGGTKSYIALDWHPRARTLFYNDKAAEEVSQDDVSFNLGKTAVAAAAAAKKQTLGLTECLKLYTSQVLEFSVLVMDLFFRSGYAVILSNPDLECNFIFT